MQETKFDVALKKRLNNYESDIPGDMWERIAAEKRKRRFAWMQRSLLALLLLLGAGTAIYFSFNYTNKGGIANEPGIRNDRKGATNKIKDSNQNGMNTTAVTHNDKIVTATDAVKDNNKSGQFKKDIYRKSPLRKKINHRHPAQTTLPGEKQNFYNGALQKDNGSNSKTAVAQTPSLPDKKKPVTADSLLTAEPVNMPGDEDKFSVEVFASPDIPVNTISSTNKSYEQLLKQSGNMQLSFNVGMRMKYHISKRFAAKIGVQYTRITGKMNFSDSYAHLYSSNNRYISVAVPLLLSYKTHWLRNADLSINSGVLVNIVSRYKGIIPSLQRQPVDLSKGNVYSKEAGASFYLSVDLSKRIQERTELFIEPWFSYRLKNMVDRYYSFEQRIHGFGMSVGVRYRLFKNEFH